MFNNINRRAKPSVNSEHYYNRHVSGGEAQPMLTVVVIKYNATVKLYYHCFVFVPQDCEHSAVVF